MKRQLQPRAAATAARIATEARVVTAARVATATTSKDEWRWIPTAIDSVESGSEDRRPSLAHLWSLWGAPTGVHQSEPRLRPMVRCNEAATAATGQTQDACL